MINDLRLTRHKKRRAQTNGGIGEGEIQASRISHGHMEDELKKATNPCALVQSLAGYSIGQIEGNDRNPLD